MRFDYAPGATPLDQDAIAGLIPDLQTQGELNAWEAANIAQALLSWKRSRGPHREILNVTALRKLHEFMFADTWKWAGKFRHTDTNIGLPWQQVTEATGNLCENVRYQIERTVYPWDELATRFHHQLVLIHPFPNGNGRHSRLATDFLLQRHEKLPFTWGSTSLARDGTARKEYLAALREADEGEIERLLRFARN